MKPARFSGFLFWVILACATAGNAARVDAQEICVGPPPAPPNAAASVTPAASSATPAAVNLSWVPVPTTGSAAATSYVIEVGTESGVTNIAMFDTGTTTASYLQYAANGTYFVRIRARNECGLSGPSPEPTVAVSGSVAPGIPSARVVLPSVTPRRDTFGNEYVTGEVRGVWGARPMAFVRVEGTFTGPTGSSVGTEFSYVFGRSRRMTVSRAIDDSTLAAGESACFAIYTTIPAASVAAFSLSMSFSTAAVEALRGNVVVQSALQEADALGDLRMSGDQTNVGATITYFNEVFFAVRDAQERVIDCDFTYVTGSSIELPSGVTTDTALAPGQTGSFVNFNGVPRSQVNRVTAWSGWEEAEPGPATSGVRAPSWRSLVSGRDPELGLSPQARARARNAAIERLRAAAANLQ